MRPLNVYAHPRPLITTRPITGTGRELLYQKGQFVEAGELLESGHGIAAGVAEFLLATHGTGARLAALRGDPSGADERLAEGQQLAEDLTLPRLGSDRQAETICAASVHCPREALQRPADSDDDHAQVRRTALMVPPHAPSWQ